MKRQYSLIAPEAFALPSGVEELAAPEVSRINQVQTATRETNQSTAIPSVQNQVIATQIIKVHVVGRGS